MERVEKTFEGLIFASRWLMAPFYLGLVVGLGVLLVFFLHELWEFMPRLMGLEEAAVIIWVLDLIDLSLAGNLIVMVMFSGYENFVSKMDVESHPDRPDWMGTIDFSAMKLKLVASIVAISAIHLLKAFMALEQYSHEHIVLLIAIHLTFVVSGAIMALSDYISEKAHNLHSKDHKH
jgi:uncharacterized protein (TIGR00645 family)